MRFIMDGEQRSGEILGVGISSHLARVGAIIFRQDWRHHGSISNPSALYPTLGRAFYTPVLRLFVSRPQNRLESGGGTLAFSVFTAF
jgi:hypothetical protein